jgi:hypothetical protein
VHCTTVIDGLGDRCANVTISDKHARLLYSKTQPFQSFRGVDEFVRDVLPQFIADITRDEKQQLQRSLCTDLH